LICLDARIAEVDCYYLNSFLQLCGKPVPILVAPPFSLEIAPLEEKYNRITLEDIVNQSYKVKLQNSDMKSILLHLYTIPSFNNCLPQQLEVFRQIPWLICGYGDDKWSIESFLSKVSVFFLGNFNYFVRKNEKIKRLMKKSFNF
jgi:hypothetical protein